MEVAATLRPARVVFQMKRFFSLLWPVLVACAAATAQAAPMGYSVNSDAAEGDKLHRIDLETGVATPIGKVMGLGDGPSGRADIEGLAFSPDGALWGVDEESRTLFPIDKGTGVVISGGDVGIGPLDALRNNDFGMTFTCSGQLYLTSVVAESLYRVTLDGTMTVVGAKGSLDARISALAAWGNPARLYGLGNGSFGDGSADSRSLYLIDPNTGTTTLLGALGPQAEDYLEAGMSFDDAGQLWALTDRGALGSQVLRIDASNGQAEAVSITTVNGFESLAVAPPGGCASDGRDTPHPDWYGIPALDQMGTLLLLFLVAGSGLLFLRQRGL